MSENADLPKFDVEKARSLSAKAVRQSLKEAIQNGSVPTMGEGRITEIVSQVVNRHDWIGILDRCISPATVSHICVVWVRDSAVSDLNVGVYPPGGNDDPIKVQQFITAYAQARGTPGERVRDNDIAAAIRAEQRDTSDALAEVDSFDCGTAVVQIVAQLKAT